MIPGATKTEAELHISVEKVVVKPKPGSKFGQIKQEADCYIELVCSLAKIEIESGSSPERGGFFWHWFGQERNKRKIAPEVYLDSPRSDFDSIKGYKGNMYCAPAHEDSDGNIICLLLQSREKEVHGLAEFRRVGLTVIRSYQGDRDEVWEKTGERQRIRLI